MVGKGGLGRNAPLSSVVSSGEEVRVVLVVFLPLLLPLLLVLVLSRSSMCAGGSGSMASR